MRKIISLIMVLFLTFGAIGCFFQLKKIDEGDNTSSSSSGTSIGKEESGESTSSGTGTSSGSTSESESESTGSSTGGSESESEKVSTSESESVSESESTSESESETPQVKTLGSLAIGSKVKVPHSVMGDIEFIVIDKNHEGYPDNSVTLFTEKVISVRCFDAKEPNNSDTNAKNYGNVYYAQSNIDQWLNSSAVAGQWYSAQHSADQSPTSAYVQGNPYADDPGFLYGFSSLFVSALLVTTIDNVIFNYTDIVVDRTEQIPRKIFLPSYTEVTGYALKNTMVGKRFDYFKNNSFISVLSDYAWSNCAADLRPSSRTSEALYWFRTPNEPRSAGVIPSPGVAYSGGSGGRQPQVSNIGVRPLCNLSSDTKVSESPDENGYYSLVFN